MQYPAPAHMGQRMFDGLNFSINFSSTIRVRGPLTLSRLENALTRLGHRYPMLVARMDTDGNNNFHFTDEDVPSVPVRVVERETENTWVREVQRELPIIFNFRTGPLYRCVWVRGQDDLSDLVLISEHMTADGRSAIHALRDLIALLAHPDLELDPVFPKRLKELVSPEILQKVAAFEAALPSDVPPSRPWQPGAPSGPQRILPFNLTETETAALREQCRAEGVTIQAALCAAFLTPFAERKPDTPMRRAEVPVDLRPYLAQPVVDLFGNYLGLTMITVDCNAGASLWDVARNAQAAIRAALGPDLFLKPPALYQLMEGPRAGGFSRDYDLSISNLGQLDIPIVGGDLQVEYVYTPTFNVNAPDHYVLGVATCSGKLCATYTSCEADGQALAEHGWALLKGMIYK
jgi:NRPS condensation-like uncharacterized protein